MGGVSTCGVPGTTVGTPEPCPTADGERAWERVQVGEASSRRAASPRAGYPARPRARRSRALQRTASAPGSAPRVRPWVRAPPGRKAT